MEQLEFRQKQFRDKNGAKVKSLTAGVGKNVSDVLASVDNALDAKAGLSDSIKNNAFYTPIPSWYSDLRQKGWQLEDIDNQSRDYGFADWGGRQVEVIVANVTIRLKNRRLGKYLSTCWAVGYISDTEFDVMREPLIYGCEKTESIKQWMDANKFDTQWDLGVQ